MFPWLSNKSTSQVSQILNTLKQLVIYYKKKNHKTLNNMIKDVKQISNDSEKYKVEFYGWINHKDMLYN